MIPHNAGALRLSGLTAYAPVEVLRTLHLLQARQTAKFKLEPLPPINLSYNGAAALTTSLTWRSRKLIHQRNKSGALRSHQRRQRPQRQTAYEPCEIT